MDERIQLTNYLYFTSLLSGGVAGFVVDVALFPLDTLKTRLQSPKGFIRSGGFRGIYKGLGPAAVGSAPTAALFFCTYESIKSLLSPMVSKQSLPFVHMTAASLAEVVACLIRVPVEIAKQRRQTSALKSNKSAIAILYEAYTTEGFFKGVYRGYGSTVLREIPFALLQFPLWEYFKTVLTVYKEGPISPLEVALCGALAGGISAAVTTPLDVAKTRIMLADLRPLDNDALSVTTMLQTVYREKGVNGLFAGVVPRVLWITLGGAIFFGSYDLTRRVLDQYYVESSS